MTEQQTDSCFVVMPISVPAHLLDRYGGRKDHFLRIFDALIAPAVESAGLIPVSPVRSGTENIQAGIINDLSGASLVLADLSAVNPNVFLELGIRSALDRPVCLVWDGFDALPFDSMTLNTHKYDSCPIYELNSEISKMADFIRTTMNRSDGRNELWKYFGSASSSLPTAELDPEDASLHAKVDRLVDLVERQVVDRGIDRIVRPSDTHSVAEAVSAVLESAGPKGVHGSRIRRLCLEILGDSYAAFLEGKSLNGRLAEIGVSIQTDDSGWFYIGSHAPAGGPVSGEVVRFEDVFGIDPDGDGPSS